MIKRIFSHSLKKKHNSTYLFLFILFFLFSTIKAEIIKRNPIRLVSYEYLNLNCAPVRAIFQNGGGYVIPSIKSFQFTGVSNNRVINTTKTCLSPTSQNPFLKKSIGNLYALEADDSNFYKTNTQTSSATVLERHRIWLNLTNATSANFSQALIGYIEGATDGYDDGYDGLYFGNDQDAIYSILNNESYTIQALALPFENTDIVPLGITTTESGATTIAIDHVDGLFLDSQPIYLEDLLLNVTHDLKATPYTFQSEIGTFNNRFLLRFNNLPLSTINQNSSKDVYVYTKNHEINIKSSLENIKKITVFDIRGRQIFDKNEINNRDFVISNLNENQTLIMQITLETGEVISKKIINQ